MKGRDIIEGALDTLYFFIFLLTVLRIRMFFSLKYSPSQGEYPSKFQLARVRRCEGVGEQTNKQTDKLTHSLTDRLVL